jgi:hypothetical protein
VRKPCCFSPPCHRKNILTKSAHFSKKTKQLSPWSTVLFEKLKLGLLVKKLPAFCGTNTSRYWPEYVTRVTQHPKQSPLTHVMSDESPLIPQGAGTDMSTSRVWYNTPSSRHWHMWCLMKRHWYLKEPLLTWVRHACDTTPQTVVIDKGAAADHDASVLGREGCVCPASASLVLSQRRNGEVRLGGAWQNVAQRNLLLKCFVMKHLAIRWELTVEAQWSGVRNWLVDKTWEGQCWDLQLFSSDSAGNICQFAKFCVRDKLKARYRLK